MILNFPTRSDEYWRYLNFKGLRGVDLVEQDAEKKPNEAEGQTLPFAKTIFFENLNTLPKPKAELLKGALQEIAAEDKLEQQLQELRNWRLLELSDSTTALNLLFDYSQFSSANLALPSLLIHVKSRQFLQLFQWHRRVSNQSLAAPRVIFWCEPSCIVEHVTVYGEGLNSTGYLVARQDFHIHQGATVRHHNYGAGGQLLRENLEVGLLAPEAHFVNRAAAWCGPGTTIDFHSEIKHLIGRCQSQQQVKSIVSDKGHFVFNGRVRIAKDAQLANSEQVNQNLALGSTSEINTKPQLEVAADDVKASHGATTGKLSEDEIFYLQSRGIPREEAQQLLRQGFLRDIVLSESEASVIDWLKQWAGLADRGLQ